MGSRAAPVKRINPPGAQAASMLPPMKAVELSLLLISAYASLNLIRSSIGFLRLPRVKEGERGNRRVSIVIPARNEEERIMECLELALSKLGESDELIVVNDCSTDLTEVRAMERLDGRCKLITLLQKPPGWTGKSWACYQGYLHSSGDVIVFLDADTRLLGNLDGVISLTEEYDAVSQVPRIACRSIACGAVEIALTSLIRLLHPYWRMDDERAWLAGAFMVWRRESYESIGTHASVRRSLVEDAELARLAVRMGMRVSFFLGGVAESRWMDSWSEAYGAIKRISLGACVGRNASLAALLLLTYTAIITHLSPLMALLGHLDPAIAIIYLASILSYASLSLVEVRTSPLAFLLAPLALPLIGLASLRARGRSEVGWKGRVYSAAEEGAQ